MAPVMLYSEDVYGLLSRVFADLESIGVGNELTEEVRMDSAESLDTVKYYMNFDDYNPGDGAQLVVRLNDALWRSDDDLDRLEKWVREETTYTDEMDRMMRRIRDRLKDCVGDVVPAK